MAYAARTHNDFTQAFANRVAVPAHLREAFIIMLMRVDHQFCTGIRQHLPQGLELRTVAVPRT